MRRAQARRRSPGQQFRRPLAGLVRRQAARGRPLGRLSSAGPVPVVSRFGIGWSSSGPPVAVLVLRFGVAVLRPTTRQGLLNVGAHVTPG